MSAMNKLLVPALLSLLCCACATPGSRINDNPAAFASLTPEQQTLVREGHIALGMPAAAVQIALGNPDRVSERTDADGTQRVWHYADTDYYSVTAPAYAYTYPYPRFADPLFYTPTVYAPYPPPTGYDRVRVTFSKDGLVSAIERDNQPL